MKNKSYLSNLTALRGVAALITVIYHVDVWIGNGGGMLWPVKNSGLFKHLYLMVDFFFILSGFIMYHVYGDWFKEKVSWDSFKQFIKARFARVYPLHLLMLVVMMAVFLLARALGLPSIPALEVENHPYSFVTNVLLLHSMNLHKWFSWVHASWSISTEWWMYMIFPFLMLRFSKLGSVGRALIVGACMLGYWAIIYFFVPMVDNAPVMEMAKVNTSDMSINVSFQYGFVRCFLGFVLGMVLYEGYLGNWGRSILSNGWVFGLCAVLPFVGYHFNVPDALTVLIFPFIILSAAYGGDGVNRILGSKPLQKIGDWSFSIYLVHQPLILLLFALAMGLGPAPTDGAAPPKMPMSAGWVVCLVIMLLTIAFSALIYRVWERPMRRKINKEWQ